MSPVVRLLTAVYARLEAPERFTTGVMARDAKGISVIPTSSRAICWCTIGAIERDNEELRLEYLDELTALKFIRAATRRPSTSMWSDNTPHTEVLAGIAAAIELAKATE